ncbi:MAG: TlpA disulfide reductase family protein [Chitinophagales bacterium]|nr:TlpA disulfide reductase family protein [Chitinophagales bacterium]
MIDFWATWCLPCQFASGHLELLQETFQDNLTVLSLSQEAAEKIFNHVLKQQPMLWIARDYNGENFKQFRANDYLPYAVILNKNGDVLWRGNPTNLTEADLRRYIAQNQNTRVRKVIEIQSIVNSTDVSAPMPDKFQVKRIPPTSEKILERTEDGLYYKGPLFDVLSELLQLPSQRLEVPANIFVEVDVRRARLSEYADSTGYQIIKQLRLKNKEKLLTGDYYTIEVKDPQKLWDRLQVVWERHDGAYFYDEYELTIDNATLAEMCYRLSVVKGELFIPQSNTSTRHDWIISYRFDDLLAGNLLETFGLELQKRNGKYVGLSVYE